MELIAQARKAVVAAAGAAVALFVAAISDGNITTAEWGAIASAVVIGVITYLTRNSGLPEGGSEPVDPNAIGRPPVGY